jgi:predicted transcriptional regulator
MHTDEFEISPSRDLGICDNTVQRIKKTLGILERKHNMTSEAFMEKLQSGALSPDHPDYKDDYAAWRSSYESLKKWEELKQQYQEALRKMKK